MPRFEMDDHHRLWQDLRVHHRSFKSDIHTSLTYMPALEDGHSPQAPDGMVDVNLGNGAVMFDRAIDRAVDAIANGADPDRALTSAVNEAALFLLREIVVDTPIDTGRARESWEITLADGVHHNSVDLGLTPPAESPAAGRARARARLGKRGIRRRFDLGGDG